MIRLKELKRRPVVHYPAVLERNGYVGEVYGYYHPVSNEYNIVSFDFKEKSKYSLIGLIVDAGEQVPIGDGLVSGVRKNNKITFYKNDIKCKLKPYTQHLDIFSRNEGILESDWMKEKSAVISGLGSVGSLVGVELAKAGVGKFLLIDNDTLQYHNVCRHQCGTRDVGKHKAISVCDKILEINPSAYIQTELSIVENVRKSTFENFVDIDTIMIGCADNREGDIYLNLISTLFNIPFISIGFWERAFAGEIFYSIPGQTPCYECLFGSRAIDLSQRTSANHQYYTNQENLAEVNFEPGISTDINFITIIGIKLILDLLNRDNNNYAPRLLKHLKQFTLVCNTNEPKIAGKQADLFSYPLQITTSISIDYSESCQACKLLKRSNP